MAHTRGALVVMATMVAFGPPVKLRDTDPLTASTMYLTLDPWPGCPGLEAPEGRRRDMPAPRLLPDNDVLAQLRTQGWSYDDIAAEYGVSRGAVHLRLKQVPGAVTKRPSYRHLLPWTVATRHASAHPANMLRLLGRRECGEPIPDFKIRMLDKWLRDVRDAKVVVCYDPDYPPNPASPTSGGFYYSRRRKSDGTNIVRTAT